MNTQHNTEFFQRTIFFIDEDPRTRELSVGETTLEAFIREYNEGDPAKAWYVKEVTTSVPVWHNDEDGEAEERYNDGSREQADLPDEHKEVITFEVRERDNHKMSGYRLIESFETEIEAEEYHLNGLYWNFCNKDDNTPFHADTRAEVEAEINILNENTSANL